MKKMWRRFLAGICTVSLLMTTTGISAMADEDESIFAEIYEDVSVIEQSDTEEQGAAPDEEEDNFEVIYEEEDEENQDPETDIPSQDMDTSESIEESISDESLTSEEEILDQSVSEEVVGDAVTSMDWTYINPVYDHLITEEDLKPLNNEAEDSDDWYIDSLKVRFFVRDQMEARADTIAVHYRTTDDYSQGQTMYRLMEGFVRAETVASYTGRGDYLLFHLAGWKGHISVFPSDDGYYNYTMTYAMTYFTDIAQENEVTEEVNRLINSWNLYEKSTYEKVKIVYDYLVQNVTFSNEFTFEDSSAYAAIINKHADCYGFYSAMCRILQECSVDIRAITGKNNIGTDNETKCAWNAVKIGSRYFNADPALEAEYYSDDQNYSYFLTKEDTSGTFHFQDEYLGGYRRYVSPFSETDYVALEKPPVWIWSQDCSSATVTFNQGLFNEVSLNAEISTEILDDSEIIYTAKVLFNGEDFTDTITREPGDVYGEPVWEWEGYFEATAVFTNNSSGDIIRKIVRTDSEFQVNDENTGAGTMTYTATVTFGNKEYNDSRTIEIIQKTYICSTREEIIQKGREAYRNHETRFMLLWPENIGITLDDIEELREGINDYTGNPLEGDYLRWSTYSSMNRETGTITKDGIEYYKWVIENCYYTTLEQENELSQWIDDRIAGFGFTNETTEFEKFITIYDYIWDNVRYDHDYKLFSNSAYSAGINGSACCLGYSNLLYRMLLEVGIDSRVIGGYIDGIILTIGDFTAPSTEHAWNIVKIGDLYYETDLTFDAGYSKDESSPYAYLTYDNCLRASLKQHVRDEEYNTEEFKTTYPMSDLSYPVVEKYSVGEGVTCNVEDGVLYISGNGKIKDIPFNVENRPWTTHIRKAVIEEGVSEIGDCVFKDSPDEFKEVVIAGSVKVIGENSFAFCHELESVDIGEGVRKIEDSAFIGCDRNLTRIEIPGTVREIGAGAFMGCEKLSEVVLNDGISIIEQHAFFTETEDSLAQITIPGSVIEIGNQAFGYYFNEGGSHTTIDPIPGFKIYGYDGSAAETYAEQNGFEFISLGTYDKKDISACSVSLHDTELVYDGVHKRPEVIVKDGDDILEKKYDYTVMYRNNLNVGTAEILVNGVGKYEGSKTLTFLITKADPVLTFAEDNISKTNLDDAFTNDLNKKTDGAVTFSSSNTAVAKVDEISGLVTIQGLGTAVITVTAEEGNNYRASSASYELTVIEGRKDISDCTVILPDEEFIYDGRVKTPDVMVKDGDSVLDKQNDYTITYRNNINAGTAEVLVKGIGIYKGTKTLSFLIAKADPMLSFAEENVFKKNIDEDFENALNKKTDGAVTFSSSNTDVAKVEESSGLVTIQGLGTAVITVTAEEGNNYRASSASYLLTVIEGRTDLSNYTVLLSDYEYFYDGTAKEPVVRVLDLGNADLTCDKDFTVTYINNKNVGTATVKVNGIGRYRGEATASFDILKKEPELKFEIDSICKTTGDAVFINTLTNMSDGMVTFTSSNTDTAEVDSISGLVTLKGLGMAVITAAVGETDYYEAGSISYKLSVISEGEGPVWLEKDGVLYIYGTGDIQDLDFNDTENSRPWSGRITRLVIEEGVTGIGECAFKDCKWLKEVTIPGSVKEIKENAFIFCCELESLEIGDGVEKIGQEAFLTLRENRNLTKLVIPGSVKEIGVNAFYGYANLSDIQLEEGIRVIGEGAFKGPGSNSALTQITIPGSVVEIGDKAVGYNGQAPVSGFKIQGYNNSAAETYAEQNGFEFVSLGEIPTKDISECTILLSDEEHIYDGKAKTPNVTVKDGESVLDLEYDYTITYRNNINAGTAEVLVNGVGKYEGSKTVTFSIAKVSPELSFADTSVSKTIQDATFTNELTKTTDGNVTFSSNNVEVATVNENTGEVSIKGAGSTVITATSAESDNYVAGSAQYTLTVKYGRIEIISQPESCQEISGKRVNLVVEAVGDGLRYQWQYLKKGRTSWADSGLSSAHNSTLTFKMSAGYDGMLFRCVLTDETGQSVTSDEVTATMISVPEIVEQPGDAEAALGETVKISVTASGTDLAYQWQYQKAGGNTWKNSGLSSAANATLKFKMSSGYDGMKFRCVIKDQYGQVVISNEVTTIMLISPVIVEQPVSVTASLNQAVSLKVDATGEGLTYKWQYQKPGRTSWNDSKLSSATSAILRFSMSSGYDGMKFRCKVTDAEGHEVYTTAVTITMAEGPAITKQPENASSPIGTKVTFSIRATGTGLTYQWQYQKVGKTTWVNSGSSGNKTNTLRVGVTEGTDGMKFRCVVTDSDGNVSLSNTAFLTAER